MIHSPRKMTDEEREDLLMMFTADIRGATANLINLLNIPPEKLYVEETGTDVYILEFNPKARKERNKYYTWLSINKDIWED